MTDLPKNSPIVQKMWDRLRVLIGAKVHKINSITDLEKVAKKYKTLRGYEKTGLIKKSNLFLQIKNKETKWIKPYTDKRGVNHKGYNKNVIIPWTKKEMEQLQAYRTKGRTLNQMSAYLARSPQSIKEKIRRIKNKK